MLCHGEVDSFLGRTSELQEEAIPVVKERLETTERRGGGGGGGGG